MTYDQRMQIADVLSPAVQEWCQNGARKNVRASELHEALAECANFDGYLFARSLERNYSWEADEDLVAILALADPKAMQGTGA